MGNDTRTAEPLTGRGSPPEERIWKIIDAAGRFYGKHHRKGVGEQKEVWWTDHKGSGRPTKEFPLYGSHRAGEWDPDEPVLIVEGEKVADAVDEAGFAVLGTLGTSHDPPGEHYEVVRGRTAIFCPDNDETGRKHMEKEAEKAYGVAAEVLWFELEEAPEKGDLADHPAVRNRDAEGLDRLLNDLLSARRYEPKKPEGLQGRVRLGELLRGGIEPTPQLLDGLLYAGKIHSVASSAGTGKTRLALWIGLRLLRLGCKVVYFDAENGPKLVAERLQELGATPEELDEGFYYYPAEVTLDRENLDLLKATMEEVRPELVVFDSFADMLAMAGLEENSNSDCTLWMGKVAQPLKDAGIAVLVLDHVPKSGSGGPRGASSKVAKVDVQWNLDVTLYYDRGRTGEITLKHTKDREGWLPKLVRFSVGGGVFARSEGTIEQRDDHGLTNSQRTALEALKPHPEGLAYSEWSGACVPSDMSKTAFDNARRELQAAGLVRNEKRRWFAQPSTTGQGTPGGTPAPKPGEETGTPGQVHQTGDNGTNPLQNSGTPGASVQEVYPGVRATPEGTPPYKPRKGFVGVPEAAVPEEDPDYDAMVRDRMRGLEEEGL